MKRILLLSGLLIAVMAASAAGKVYTLEECIQMALEKDPAVTQARSRVSVAKATVWEQAGAFLPTASLYYSSTQTNSGPEAPRLEIVTIRDTITGEYRNELVNTANPNSLIRKGFGAGISFDYTLFNGFQNVWNYLGSRASKRQTAFDLTSSRSKLIFDVKTSYYIVLKAKRDLEVAQDVVKRSEELLKLFQEKYDLGSASLSEVLKQKVQYGNDKLTLITKENELEIYYDNLALAVGLDPRQVFEIANLELRREPTQDIDKLIAESKQWHPGILAAEASEDASVYDVRSTRGTYLPTLGLSYSYGWRKDFFHDIVKGGPFDHSATLQLTLNFRLFDGFSRERNMARATATLNDSRAQLYYVRNQVIRNLEDAYLGIKLADEKLAVTEETERWAKEDFDLVQAKYNLGAAALWELLDAQVSLKEAQFGKVTAEFDYNLALALLQNALGK